MILDTQLGKALLENHADGEIRLEIHESVRGIDVFLLQSAHRPVNDNLMEYLIMIDAMKRASAGRINAIMPYFAYARQDQKDKPRASITAKMVANLLGVAGIDRFASIELHAGQIEGFFDVPADDIAVIQVFAEDLKDKLSGGEVVLAPDSAGVARARMFAESLNLDLALIDFRAIVEDRALHIVGDVYGRPVIVIDDMIDTGRTLNRAAKAARAAGAKSVVAYCVHPVLSGGVLDILHRAPIDSLVVTDTIPLSPAAAKHPKIRVVSIAPILAEVIMRMHNDEPLDVYLH